MSCRQKSELLETRSDTSNSRSCPILEETPMTVDQFHQQMTNINNRWPRTLTSKLICPPTENVMFKCSNLSLSTATILERIPWTYVEKGMYKNIKKKLSGFFASVPYHISRIHHALLGYNSVQLEKHWSSRFGIQWRFPWEFFFQEHHNLGSLTRQNDRRHRHTFWSEYPSPQCNGEWNW